MTSPKRKTLAKGGTSASVKVDRSKRGGSGVVLPVQTCPSFRGGHLPDIADVQRLRSLTAPHVESFNYFLEKGLAAGIQSIEPAELDLIDTRALAAVDEADDEQYSAILDETATLQFWLEDASIAKPIKAAASGRNHDNKLLPREARERGLMYSATITAKFCYRILERRNGIVVPNKVVKLSKTFGDMPIMVLSNSCHLKDATPLELSRLKEEVSLHGLRYTANNKPSFCLLSRSVVAMCTTRPPFLVPVFSTKTHHLKIHTLTGERIWRILFGERD